jgi:hypothetical protein
MATAVRVTRVRNPTRPRRSYRRVKTTSRRRKTNVRSYRNRRGARRMKRASNRRRHMSAKQIRYFGTKRQRNALKSRRKRTIKTSNRRTNRFRRKRSNLAAGFWREDPDDPQYQIWHPIRASYDYDPKRAHLYYGGPSERKARRKWTGKKTKKRSRTVQNRKRTYNRRRTSSRRKNPLLVEFATVNPRGGVVHRTYRKRGKQVARSRNRRRRSLNYRRRRHNRRRSNPTTAVTRPRRRRVYHRHRPRRHSANPRRNYRGRRRNPVIFGQSSAKEIGFMIMGGLVGVAAVKYLPTLLPAGITGALGGGGGIVSVGITIAGAFVAGWVGGMWDKSFGDAVLFGGLMQAGSQLLGMFLNPNPLALSGLGDIVATRGFVVPQNPVLQPMAAPPPSKGMGAFRGAFGYRR